MRSTGRSPHRGFGSRTSLALVRWIAVVALVSLGAISSARAADEPSAQASPAGAPGTVQSIPGTVRAENVAVITITDVIDPVTARSFKRRMERAIEAGADAIVVDLDTPGGEVPSVLEICAALETCPVHTIAWIHPNAYSGGAITALACNEIVISGGATMGDAAPVQFDYIKGISKIVDPEERQKQLAPILAQVVGSAREHGYDEVLVQAMISLGVRTWMVEDIRTGDRHFLTEHEYRSLFHEDPPSNQPLVASGGDTNAYVPLPIDPDLNTVGSPTGFLPASGQFDAKLAGMVNTNLDGGAVSTRPDFAREDPANYRSLGYATDGRALLTLKGGQLRSFGFVRHAPEINTDDELKAYVGATNLVRLDQSWMETVVGYMTQGFTGLVIRGVLIVVFLIAIFLELSMPGVGLPGIIALCALGLLVGPPMMLGASTWWAAGAILGGVGLLLLEILVFPGFGVPGIAGMALLLAGLVGTFAGVGQLFPGVGAGSGTQLFWAASTVLLALFAAGTAMFFITKYTRSIPIANRLVLFESHRSGSDTGAPAHAMAGAAIVEGPVAIGTVGIATTPLKPSGTAEFGDQLVDVVAEFGFIDPGRRVRVVSATTYRVGVELVDGSGEGGTVRERTA